MGYLQVRITQFEVTYKKYIRSFEEIIFIGLIPSFLIIEQTFSNNCKSSLVQYDSHWWESESRLNSLASEINLGQYDSCTLMDLTHFATRSKRQCNSSLTKVFWWNSHPVSQTASLSPSNTIAMGFSSVEWFSHSLLVYPPNIFGAKLSITILDWFHTTYINFVFSFASTLFYQNTLTQNSVLGPT